MTASSEIAPAMVSQIEGVTGYINAGGRGVRISPAISGNLNDPIIGVSKALLEIGSDRTPLIDYHLCRLLGTGISNIVVGVGDHTRVKDYIDGAYEAHPGVYAYETPKQRGTGGDLIAALQGTLLFARSVLINNVDTLLDIDERELIESHKAMDAGMTIALTTRKGVPNEGAFMVGERDVVLFSAEAAKNKMNKIAARSLAEWVGSSTGMLVVETELLHEFAKTVEPEQEVSLYKEMVGYALGQQVLRAFNNKERYFLDVGTADAWGQAEADAEMIQSLLSGNDRR